MDNSTNITVKTETERPTEDQPKAPAKSMTARAYLDSTINPVLLLGLAELARVKPEDPFEWLGNYLLQNNPLKQVKKE